MKRLALALLPLLAATAVQAAVVNGVSSITTNFNAASNATGGTNLANAGTHLDGLYGTENLGYLVDGFPGTLGLDGLVMQARAVVNDEGTVSGADQSAVLGFSNPATGHRSETQFGLMFLGPNDGRIFALIGGGLVGSLGDWATTFGRNHPFDIDVSSSLVGSVLTMTGSITDGTSTININTSGNVNPAATVSAFGTSSGFEQIGVQRNFGMDFSAVAYTSSIPEPGGIALAAVALMVMPLRRRLSIR